MCSKYYSVTEVDQALAKIIIDNEAAIAMATCNKDTAMVTDMLPEDIIMSNKSLP